MAKENYFRNPPTTWGYKPVYIGLGSSYKKENGKRSAFSHGKVRPSHTGQWGQREGRVVNIVHSCSTSREKKRVIGCSLGGKP